MRYKVCYQGCQFWAVAGCTSQRHIKQFINLPSFHINRPPKLIVVVKTRYQRVRLYMLYMFCRNALVKIHRWNCVIWQIRWMTADCSRRYRAKAHDRENARGEAIVDRSMFPTRPVCTRGRHPRLLPWWVGEIVFRLYPGLLLIL